MVLVYEYCRCMRAQDMSCLVLHCEWRWQLASTGLLDLIKSNTCTAKRTFLIERANGSDVQWFTKVWSTTDSKGLVGLVGYWTVKGKRRVLLLVT